MDPMVIQQMPPHTAQRNKTGWVLSFLPAFLVGALYGVLYFVDPGMMSLLWKNPVGIKMLLIALGLQMVNALIIRETIHVEEAVHKTVIKSLVVAVLFLPSLFLVVLGPAMICIVESFTNLNH